MIVASRASPVYAKQKLLSTAGTIGSRLMLADVVDDTTEKVFVAANAQC
jgi:hypothetical protein